MSDPQYTWFSFVKKILEFLRFVISFFRGRKDIEAQKQKDKFDKTTSDIKSEYDKIEKEKQDKEKDELDKRLKNLF